MQASTRAGGLGDWSQHALGAFFGKQKHKLDNIEQLQSRYKPTMISLLEVDIVRHDMALRIHLLCFAICRHPCYTNSSLYHALHTSHHGDESCED
jgi:hypothetical protein